MDGHIYTPGAGHMPYELVGREDLLTAWAVQINDVRASGRVAALDIVLVGPRGIGKTAAMQGMLNLAAKQQMVTISLQAVKDQAGIVTSLISHADQQLAERSGPWVKARQAFERVAGVGLGVAGVSASLSTRPQDPPPNATPSNLADALAALADATSGAHGGGGVVIAVDELQVATAADLALVAATLHRLNVDHPSAAVMFIATGLPNVPDALRAAGVTHPDRLFDVQPVPGHLTATQAAAAIIEPAAARGVVWQPAAVAAIVDITQGYPAHLQLFAHKTWQVAPGPTRITLADAQQGILLGAADVERRSFGPRWDAMPPRQQEFIAALAVAGGVAPIRQLASALGRATKDISQLRDTLIKQGDIYSPHRGTIALATPLFGRYALDQYEPTSAASGVVLHTLAELRSGLED